MSFQKPITIKSAINGISKNNYLLPAIQREFVWTTKQIERLFDSLMRDYPISSFLFWKVEDDNIQNYQFYEFIQHYHERDNSHNTKADIDGKNSITAILDGQQRLTSLYIGLKGTYREKLFGKRWTNDQAFPEKKLYLNLFSQLNENNFEYEFKFLTKGESQEHNENCFWYEVGNILDIKEMYELSEYVLENIGGGKNAIQASKTIHKLYDVINRNESINYFLEESNQLDKVLNVFIRVNSGGTLLSYSDLLLSIATAQWKEKDAREEVHNFVDELCKLGNGFNINKDLVLKSCLVLSDIPNIAFKVDNFNQENMRKIEISWDNITESLRLAVLLVSNFGYHQDTLTSHNALIPIAYYLNKIGNPSNYVESASYREDRENIFKWLRFSLLKRAFSGQPDSVLRPIREIIKQGDNSFPLAGITNRFKGTNKSIIFNQDDIDNILDYDYGKAHTYSALALIYPSLDFSNKFHQDHIFPKSLFNPKKLQKIGISDEHIGFYMAKYNGFANLQLLAGIPNKEKSAKDFSEWLDGQPHKETYMETHYIPKDIDLSLTNFKAFIEKREELIKTELSRLLKPAER